ncbi:MAG TPA: hypothetical protein PK529_01085 [Verrucomicrobiales bacterium]|nr:hypothetical protein [Verrucomicrobiales bacterium]
MSKQKTGKAKPNATEIAFVLDRPGSRRNAIGKILPEEEGRE